MKRSVHEKIIRYWDNVKVSITINNTDGGDNGGDGDDGSGSPLRFSVGSPSTG